MTARCASCPWTARRTDSAAAWAALVAHDVTAHQARRARPRKATR